MLALHTAGGCLLPAPPPLEVAQPLEALPPKEGCDDFAKQPFQLGVLGKLLVLRILGQLFRKLAKLWKASSACDALLCEKCSFQRQVLYFFCMDFVRLGSMLLGIG